MDVVLGRYISCSFLIAFLDELFCYTNVEVFIETVMKTKFPKKKKISKATWKRKLDAMFSRLVRSSYGYCQFKGKDHIKCSRGLQCMHIVGRSNLRLRWEFMNCLAGCPGHHIYYTHHPLEFIEAVMICWPEKYLFIREHKNELLQETYEEVERRLKLT